MNFLATRGHLHGGPLEYWLVEMMSKYKTERQKCVVDIGQLSNVVSNSE